MCRIVRSIVQCVERPFVRANIVPRDSILRLWIKNLHVTEVPISYQVLCGLGMIGAILKRSVFIDQKEWRVYPNMSVLLIGPSGVGKDTIINKCNKIIHGVNPDIQLNGSTMEFIQDELSKMESPAAAYIPANELTAFLGSKDYQKGMAQCLTDLLSTGDKVVLGTKGGGKKVIKRPTLTIFAGSTADWLRDLPENSIAGGFLPRFIIVCEDYSEKDVAWVEYDWDYFTKIEAYEAGEAFKQQLQEVLAKFGQGSAEKCEKKMTPTTEAIDFYRNWYANRFKYFSDGVKAYANRSRDQMHRLAMLMAISRMHWYVDERDYRFAADVMEVIAKGLDQVVAPMLADSKRKRR